MIFEQMSTYFCPGEVFFLSLTGDIFRDELPKADLFILCHVIENWKNDKSHIILEKAFDKLPQGILTNILMQIQMSHVLTKPVLAMCKQQRCRSACASAQSDQHLYCSLLR